MARKILLADDSVTAQNMGRKILADAGYEVITVNNGSAALKKIAELKPDLIVLDVYMPGYSGLEVCQRLKEVPETSRIPVILTVGKLEPFKPEEARRVRAEGFIVKPFEASELLSALSKLEDKIVPRSEPSKPGRFARAIAAVEQSNRDRNVPLEEDSGWKNRISFPSNKKKKEESGGGDDRAVYNTGNRDKSTVVPPEQARKKLESRKQEAGNVAESTVDVAAVAPAELPADSLPKDVTAQEIAAIAAAAAQVQGAIAACQESSETPADTQGSAAEFAGAGQKSEPAESNTGKKADEVPPATFAGYKSSEEKLGLSAVSAEKEQEKEAEPEEDRKDTPGIPDQVEVAAAMATLESGTGKSWNTSDPENGAGHSALPAGPRWTAVPVAMDAVEAAASLEHEMQRAQASLVASEVASEVAPETGYAGSAVAVVAPPEATISSAPEPAAVVEPMVRAVTHEETELAHALSAAASVAAEPVTTAVTELPAISASHVDSMPSAPADELAAPAQAAEEAEFQAGAHETAQEAHAAEQYPAVPDPQAQDDAARAEGNLPVAATADTSSTNPNEPQSAEPGVAVVEAPLQNETPAGGTRAMAEKRDSELAATTAAAWASWRQIRSDEPSTSEPARARQSDDEDDDEFRPAEAAAMAVAAGAEKSPEEGAPGADPRAIASIVDSVLAEMRPKIVEEISRKLGEKK